MGHGDEVESKSPTAVAPKPPPEPPWSDDVVAIGALGGVCPPAEALACSGKYFRLDGVPDDWQTYLARGLVGPKANAKKKCEAASISCFRSVEELREKMQMRKNFATSKIYEAELEPGHGVCEDNKATGHSSVWLRRQFAADPKKLFTPAGSSP